MRSIVLRRGFHTHLRDTIVILPKSRDQYNQLSPKHARALRMQVFNSAACV